MCVFGCIVCIGEPIIIRGFRWTSTTNRIKTKRKCKTYRHVRTLGKAEAITLTVLAQGALTINSLYTWYIYQLVSWVWWGSGGESVGLIR